MAKKVSRMIFDTALILPAAFRPAFLRKAAFFYRCFFEKVAENFENEAFHGLGRQSGLWIFRSIEQFSHIFHQFASANRGGV